MRGGPQLGGMWPRADSAAELGGIRRLEEILRALEAAEGGVEEGGEAARISESLKEMEELLASDEECLDYLFACSSVSMIFKAFRFDNLKVLRILARICGAGSSVVAGAAGAEGRTPKRAHEVMFLNETTVDHLELVADCVLKRGCRRAPSSRVRATTSWRSWRAGSHAVRLRQTTYWCSWPTSS